MDGIKRLITFGLGGAIGTAVGAAFASLMAPQTGKQLQESTHQLVDEVKAAGDQAQAETEAKLITRYREMTGSSASITDIEGLPAGDTPARLPSSTADA